MSHASALLSADGLGGANWTRPIASDSTHHPPLNRSSYIHRRRNRFVCIPIRSIFAHYWWKKVSRRVASQVQYRIITHYPCSDICRESTYIVRVPECPGSNRPAEQRAPGGTASLVFHPPPANKCSSPSPSTSSRLRLSLCSHPPLPDTLDSARLPDIPPS